MDKQTLLERLRNIGKEVAPIVTTTALFVPTATSATPQPEKQSITQKLNWLNQSQLDPAKWYYQEKIGTGYRQMPITQIDEKILKQSGIDTIQNGFGQSLLTSAVMNGKEDAVALLIAAGADVNKPNALNQTPGYLAVNFGRYKKNPETLNIIKRLIKAGMDLNQQDADGRTLAMEAANRGDTQVVELLEKSGADMTVCDKEGRNIEDYHRRHQNRAQNPNKILMTATAQQARL